jgi:putative endonuclease
LFWLAASLSLAASFSMYVAGRIVELSVRALDALARFLPRKNSGPQHLETGRRGEDEAYFYLRQQGYVMVARNYRSPRSRSELDMVGWDGETLCFIEVKTRTTRQMMPAEAAVDPEKQRDLGHVAREFVRKSKDTPACRFDVVSVYLEPGRPADVTLFKDAFRLS